MLKHVVDGCAHRSDLRPNALLGRRARTVRIDLGGGDEARIGHPRAQAQALAVVFDDAGCQHRRADDRAIRIGRRDVGHLGNRIDDRALERRLWASTVIDQASTFAITSSA